MKVKVLLVVLSTLLLAPSAYAGWVVEERSEHSGMGVETSTYYWQGDTWKMVEGSEITLVNLAEKTMYMLSHEHKAYAGGSVDELREEMNEVMGAGMQQAYQTFLAQKEQTRKMVEMGLQNAPPEQRGQMEEMLKSLDEIKTQEDFEKQYGGMMQRRMPGAETEEPDVRIKDTDEKDKILGYRCRKYEIWVDGVLDRALWIASDVEMYRDVGKHRMREMYDLMLSVYGGVVGMDPVTRAEMELLEKGIALRTVKYDDYEEVLYEDEITKIEKRKMPSSDFRVPEGYRRLSMVEAMKMKEESESSEEQ